MRRLACTVAATLAELLAAGAHAVPPLPPPYAGAYQPQGVDEIGMWREMDEEERVLATSPLVIRDEALTGYITRVLCSTVGDDRCKATRIYVIREPSFNASMAPNGTMRVYSGLLLRMRNEAELAAILGHEFGHFESRHSLQQFRSRRSGTDLLAWTAVLASMAAPYGGMQTYRDMQLQVYGTLYRFGRDQEREADLLGLAYLNRSDYRPQAAAQVWENFMGEMSASASAKGLSKPNFKKIAFTASHPPEGERASYLAELAAPEGAGRDDGVARYRAALATWTPRFLEDQIKLNDFGGSDYLIQALAQDGWTAQLWFSRGELYRSRGHPRDLIQAADFYANAIKADPDFAEAYRGLGLSKLKTGVRAEAWEGLRSYLRLKPDASDATMIKMMLPKETAHQ
ncbi:MULTISPECIES: M48 family metallopeptidase [unclassified Sphingobium]|uniref:M48 family metallopeptidase n=1 Tax=unclassified Sphingobium TaxID=2611147 RepID=UPI00222448F1|nr:MULTISPECIES: M48 family metallopeptidase [unclassified Sphingobium]MCW2348940.1 putative Zn-dependent protease [Sphingobium sp. B12D2B]MCW2368069.1 putative Zn-dependent protease [Sphingobium sp. B11D3D]